MDQSLRTGSQTRARSAFFVYLVAWLSLFVSACDARETDGNPPVLVDGVLDARGWDFESAGPLRLAGAWEILPEATLEGEAIASSAPSGDFVEVPWGRAHQKTRQGRDVDAWRWVQLRARIRAPEASPGFVLEVEEIAESFVLECRSASGHRSLVRAGIVSPGAAERYVEGLFPRADLAVPGDTTCVLTAPRAALGRVRVLSAPWLERSDLAPRRKLARSMVVIANCATALTFVAFAAIMVATERRNRVAIWSLTFGALFLLRILLSNRGLLFDLHGDGFLAKFPWWRAEYVDLWLFTLAFCRYGECLIEKPLPFRRSLSVILLALCVLAIGARYDLAKRLLPVGESAGVALAAIATFELFRAPSSRAIRIARLGVLVALVGFVGTAGAMLVSGRPSPVFELIGSAETLFQMAVVAVRAQEARQKSADVAGATQQFVPRQFLEELGHADVTTTKLGDAASRRLTIFFADIRNFTAASERMTPEQTFAFLNGCLSELGPHVRAHGGFVDKYIGDAIMALFPGAPSDAVRAAAAMQAALRRSNEASPERAPLAVGIGIHLGSVMMGTIGEAERFEATVISDAVNLTARLESLTKQLGCSVLVTGEVFETLEPDLRMYVRRLGTFVVKGKVQPVALHEVFVSDGEALRTAKLRARASFERMLDAFADERVDEALAVASELCDACPDDGPARWWHTRLVMESAVASEQGAPSNRGVVRLDEK